MQKLTTGYDEKRNGNDSLASQFRIEIGRAWLHVQKKEAAVSRSCAEVAIRLPLFVEINRALALTTQTNRKPFKRNTAFPERAPIDHAKRSALGNTETLRELIEGSATGELNAHTPLFSGGNGDYRGMKALLEELQRNTAAKLRKRKREISARIGLNSGVAVVGNIEHDHVRALIERAFADVFDLMDRCRFRDCKHEEEPDCAVRRAIEAGTLGADRLVSLKRLVAEEAAKAAKA